MFNNAIRVVLKSDVDFIQTINLFLECSENIVFGCSEAIFTGFTVICRQNNNIE